MRAEGPWHHLLMWLTSFDMAPPWGPVEVRLIGPASIGARTDFAGADLEPPIQTDDNHVSRVLLGPRHQGGSVWSEPDRWPVHVFVCAPWDGRSERPGRFAPDGFAILYWGLLHQTRERAELDEY
jgi:hypothetical protein